MKHRKKVHQAGGDTFNDKLYADAEDLKRTFTHGDVRLNTDDKDLGIVKHLQ